MCLVSRKQNLIFSKTLCVVPTKFLKSDKNKEVMSALARYVPNLLNPMKYITTVTSKFLQPTLNFHSLTNEGRSQINPGGLFNVSTRTNIRVHFPRPSERKRIKRHGWKTRMSTPEGRRVLMNRILKGRFVYSH